MRDLSVVPYERSGREGRSPHNHHAGSARARRDGAVGDDCTDNARQRLHQPAAGRSPELDCRRQRERALRRVHLAGDRPRPRRHKPPPRRVRDRPQERTHAAREREQQRRAGEGRPESGRRLGRARDQRKRPLRALPIGRLEPRPRRHQRQDGRLRPRPRNRQDPAHSAGRPRRLRRRAQRERSLRRPGSGRERVRLRPAPAAPAPSDGGCERLERRAVDQRQGPLRRLHVDRVEPRPRRHEQAAGRLRPRRPQGEDDPRQRHELGQAGRRQEVFERQQPADDLERRSLHRLPLRHDQSGG